ncbi:response regulator [Candidatus Woesebacteria bacterium]|nr:response regulator [Candidatus Woesebacteria bacterium]
MAKTILIVDDEPALLKALSSKVLSLGYRVVEATNGDQAISQFKKEKPDLVLLDVVMPQKNGFEVLEELTIKMHSRVPVIILSNLEQNQDIETGKNLGAKDYIVKSNISLRDIMIKIHNTLK